MAAIYVKDPQDVTHLTFPHGDGEFTFCNRSMDGDEVCDGFLPRPGTWPCDCADCFRAFSEMKEGMKGARFTRKARNAPEAT